MGDSPVILVVDDKHNMLSLMSKVLEGDAKVLTADNGARALQLLASEPVDVVLCDLKMPDMDGLEVLRSCRRMRPGAEFILMTAHATVDTAIEALKLGAYDYLSKPFKAELARAVVLRALSRVAVSEAEPGTGSQVLPGVIARSPPMRQLADLVRRIADSDVTTLILGETGTGKEPVARAVHGLSPRASKRFVAINCAAIPPELLESELFGHARGSFTGATAQRKGLFEEADGGTLFLDEIGDMRPSLQAKLTRALEERTIRRVGESHERPVDVRLIAATHRDLEAMVAEGTFREDLWYRLNVALVAIPALRERREDIELLAYHFLRQQAERSPGRTGVGFSRAAIDTLVRYDWPGNVRQLRSAVERSCVVSAREDIAMVDLPPELLRTDTVSMDDPVLLAGTWSEALERGRDQAGKRYLKLVLRRFHGQIQEAATHAGVERESFYRLLRKHAVDPATYRTDAESDV